MPIDTRPVADKIAELVVLAARRELSADDVIAELESILNEIETDKQLAVTAAATKLCGARAPGTRSQLCDRPDGHKPQQHSWEAARYKRIAIEYEEQLTQIPKLHSQLRAAQSLLRKRSDELEKLQMGPQAYYGRKRSKPDRG